MGDFRRAQESAPNDPGAAVAASKLRGGISLEEAPSAAKKSMRGVLGALRVQRDDAAPLWASFGPGGACCSRFFKFAIGSP